VSRDRRDATREHEDDLDRELRTHVENEADDRRDAGLPADDAAFAARRTLGNIARIREDVRALSPWSLLDDFLQDLRYGARMLRKHPGFTLIAACTLALGIGATTTIFSVVDSVLLRPLPFRDSERLALVSEDVDFPSYKNRQNTPAPGNFTDWRARNSTFIDLAAVRDRAWSLTGAGEPIRVSGETATASVFSILHVEPILGRGFTAEEDMASPSRVVLLGHALWVDRFGSDPSIVGRTIHLDDEPYVVVGVMPRGFNFPNADDQIWTPLGLTPEQRANHGSHYLRVYGRLKDGVTIAQAQADLEIIASRLTAQYPDSNTGVGVSVVSLRDAIVGDVRRPLLIMLGVVGFLLLMACANIGNLLVARASSRERELALRTAVGASRSRIVRQLLAESVLLALIGGALGLWVALEGVAALKWWSPANLPRLDSVHVSGTMMALDVCLAIAAGVLSGLVPVWQLRHGDVRQALQNESKGSASRARLGVRNALVAFETALGVVVLIGAGLLLRSFVELTRVPVGFDSRGILTFRVALPAARYVTAVQRLAFYHAAVEQLHALPGVSAASAISYVPLSMNGGTTGVSVDDDTPADPIRFADVRSVTPGYFSAMSIPLVAGRDLSWADGPDAPPVVIVSQTTAQTFWPGRDAIGQRIRLGRRDRATAAVVTVVGIAANVRQLDLVRAPRPALYFPGGQDQGSSPSVLRDWIVRVNGDPTAAAASVRRVIASLDASLPVTRMQTLNEVRAATTASQRFNLTLVGLFGGVALLLAAIGIYGVTAYSVSQRRHELGIRLALGSSRSQLLRLVLGHGARLAVAGLAAGTAVAMALADLVSALLFGISARDPLTFAGVCALLFAVSLIASLVPAYRAARVDPMTALR